MRGRRIALTPIHPASVLGSRVVPFAAPVHLISKADPEQIGRESSEQQFQPECQSALKGDPLSASKRGSGAVCVQIGMNPE